MAYKRINEVLIELNHLSNPGMKEDVESVLLTIDEKLSNQQDLALKYLSYIVVGFQHGYSAKSVAEFITRDTISWSVAEAKKATVISPVIEVSLNKDATIFYPQPTFYSDCDYNPASDELDKDPLNVICDINARRYDRQKVIVGSVDGDANIIYPTFGNWVDNTIRVGSAAEARYIKLFRDEIGQEIKSLHAIWFD